MIIDGILLALMLFSGIYGLRKGFMFTFVHTAGWIMSLVLAFIGTPYAKEYITENTDWYDRFIPAIPVPDGVPEIISDITIQVTSNFIFTVAIYIVLFIAIKLVLTILLKFISNAYRGGFIGFFDAFFGLAIGLIRGVILVFVFLTAMIPVAEIFAPDIIPAILANLDSSYAAKTLYDNNYIVLLLQNFFAEMI